MDLESTRTRITSLVVSVHQTLLTPLASRFLTPPTRPEHLKRPESGRPWGVKNSRTVQSGSSVQSKNFLNYTVCYTSLKITLQAAQNKGFANQLFSVNKGFAGLI